MKRSFIVILIFITCLSFSYPEKTVTLKIIWWGSLDRHEKTLKVIEIYRKRNPGIKIEPIYTSWTGYYEKLATLVAANEMPDIVQMAVQNIPQYDDKNLFEDLYRVSTIDIKDMDTTAINSGIYNDKLLGISLGSTAPALVYNKEMFLKAGIGFPTEKWTWEDLENASNEIRRKLLIPGIYNMAVDYNDFEIYAREKGESLYSGDLKKVGFKENTLCEFLKMCLRMQKSQAMENIKVSIESRANEEKSSYAKQKTAMRFLWSNKIVSVFNSVNMDSEITVYPGANNFAGIYVKPSMFFSISRSSKYKEEAGKFISFFVNDLEANKILNSERGVPVFSKVRRTMIPQLDSQNAKIFEYIDLVSRIGTRKMDPQFSEYDREVKKEMQMIFEKVMYEKIKPEEGASILIRKWNSILSKSVN
jgi:multiple sugar transport system substrate-binding protein